MHFSRACTALFAGLLLAACSDANSLPQPTDANFVDTTTIYALEGTPVTRPSGFSLPERIPVRTDQTSAFDFAFNLDAAGQPVFLPLALLGLGGTTANPGLKATTDEFAAITLADRDGYVTEDTVRIAAGNRYLARSRVVCGSLGVPQYGKLEVLSIDPVERSITFQFLIDNNCGYLGLEPGLPEE